MKQESLVAATRRRRRYNSYIGEISPAPDNLLTRDFSASAPNGVPVAHDRLPRRHVVSWSTDAHCRTSAADVFALGDCAAVDGRLQPFVLPIAHAARALGATLTGTPTAVDYPAMPISVKTPAVPAVIASPSAEEGAWNVRELKASSESLSATAIFHDMAGRARGFALVGDATREKAAMLKVLAAADLERLDV